MRIGSLFSGVGGLELGLEWAGVGHTVWQVEQNEYCRSVLARHWPDADRSTTDVRGCSAGGLDSVDVICGGFPCQDISNAGKGVGLAGSRSGLWFEFARIVGEFRPKYVVVENVSALLARGIDAVLGSLASLGYDAVWTTLRAADVGAPHRRERLFIVAYSNGLRELQPQRRNKRIGRRSSNVGPKVLAYPKGERCAEMPPRIGALVQQNSGNTRKAESRLGRSVDGIPARLDRWPATLGEDQKDWEPPRTIEKANERAPRLKALGNAVVPQQAFVVGKMLMNIAGSD